MAVRLMTEILPDEAECRREPKQHKLAISRILATRLSQVASNTPRKACRRGQWPATSPQRSRIDRCRNTGCGVVAFVRDRAETTGASTMILKHTQRLWR